MTTGIFLNCRLSSTRFPEKHLTYFDQVNLTMIEILIKRLLYHFEKEINEKKIKLILTTSHLKINYKFDKLLNKYNIEIFHGNDTNIPYRHLRCCEMYTIDNVISICGDNMLISMDAVRKVYEKMNEGVSILKTVGLPIGMNVAGYTYKTLKESLKNVEENSNMETGWYIVFSYMEEIKMGDYDLFGNMRLTMDYPKDFEFLYKVVDHVKDNIINLSDTELLDIIHKNKYNEINGYLSKQYWDNFNKKTDIVDFKKSD